MDWIYKDKAHGLVDPIWLAYLKKRSRACETFFFRLPFLLKKNKVNDMLFVYLFNSQLYER
jgi:hypothetical protein